MKILFFGNNRLALDALRWLRAGGEEIVGLAVHPVASRRLGDELIAESGLPPERILDGSRLREPEVLERARGLGAELGLSVLFGYVIKPELLALFPRGALNLHPALLPYNRGAYPNVWSIIDRTPAGVTLHFMDAGLDTGDIVAQREVEVAPTDTGATLYRKLEAASFELLREAWPAIAAGAPPRRPQSPGGTSHRVRDVEGVDAIDLDRSYTARELLDVLRARTFAPYRGAYFTVDGRKIYVRVELLEEKDLGSPEPASKR